ncbi:hypothetical protein ACIXR5_14045 [Bacteroides fragilis]
MILKYVSPILQMIKEGLNHIDKEDIRKSSFEFNIQDILNAKVAEAFNNKEELDIMISHQIANAWMI